MGSLKRCLSKFSLFAILWNIITFSQFMLTGIQLPDANIKKNNKDED